MAFFETLICKKSKSFVNFFFKNKKKKKKKKKKGRNLERSLKHYCIWLIEIGKQSAKQNELKI